MNTKANALSRSQEHAILTKDTTIIGTVTKPFTRLGKGNVDRGNTMLLYKTDVADASRLAP